MIEAIALAALAAASAIDTTELSPAHKRELAKQVLHGPKWTFYYGFYDTFSPLYATIRSKSLPEAFRALKGHIRAVEGLNPLDEDLRIFAVIKGGRLLTSKDIREHEISQVEPDVTIRELFVYKEEPLVVELSPASSSLANIRLYSNTLRGRQRCTRPLETWFSMHLAGRNSTPSRIPIELAPDHDRIRPDRPHLSLAGLRGTTRRIAEDHWGTPEHASRLGPRTGPLQDPSRLVRAELMLGGTLIYVSFPGEGPHYS